MQKLILFAVLLGESGFERAGTDASVYEMPALLTWGAPPRSRPAAEMVTDRPDFTESPWTVGSGVVQLETGITVRFRSLAPDEHLHRWDWGETLLRWGWGPPWLEGRLFLTGTSQLRHVGPRRQWQQGWEDAVAGFKFALVQQQGPWPQVAAVVQTTLPTGSKTFAAQAWQPGAMFLAGWELGPRWNTAGSFQLHFLRAEEERLLLQTALSWTLSARIASRCSGFAEWYSLIHSGPGAANEHFFNVGLAWLITPDCQWDVRFGRGFHPGQEWFAGSGLSIRWR